MAAFTSIDNPELYFQVKLYTGNGSTQSITLDVRESEVIIARMKNNKFGLNFYDSSRKITHDTKCPNCNHAKESTHHFFFDCPAYDSARDALFS